MAKDYDYYFPNQENDESYTFFEGVRGNFEKTVSNFQETDAEIQSLKTNIQQAKKQYFDFRGIRPRHFTKLLTSQVTVMQSFVVDEFNNHIFMSQVDNTFQNDNVGQSFRLTRCAMDGREIDYMGFEHGGHGTAFGIEVNGQDVFVWTQMEKYDAAEGRVTTYQCVRVKYTPGAVVNFDSDIVQKFPHLPERTRVTPAVDTKNRQMALRRYRSDADQWAEILDLDDILNGEYKVLGTVRIAPDDHYMQGHSLDDGHYYWYAGDTNSVTRPNDVIVYDTETGEEVYRQRITAGAQMIERYENDFREPEGIYMYTDPVTKAKALLVGLTSGPGGGRLYNVYAYHSPENFMKHVPIIRQPLIPQNAHNSATAKAYQPYFQAFMIEYIKSSKSWAPLSSGYAPNYFHSLIEKVVIEGTDLAVYLRNKYQGLINVQISGDDNLNRAGLRVANPMYAGGGDSNRIVLRFIDSNNKEVAPTIDALENGARISVLILAMDPMEV